MADNIPMLLGWAVLLPLVSFVAILIAGPRMGKAGALAGWVATLAIVGAGVLSVTSLTIWLVANPLVAASEADHPSADTEGHASGPSSVAALRLVSLTDSSSGAFAVSSDEEPLDSETEGSGARPSDHPAAAHGEDHAHAAKPYIAGDWYTLGQFGKLKLTIGYYVDALTVAMFCMVTLIASCIHFYAMGYMHDELHSFTDPEVVLDDGSQFTRPGRYHRFFQFLSLF